MSARPFLRECGKATTLRYFLDRAAWSRCQRVSCSTPIGAVPGKYHNSSCGGVGILWHKIDC
jgi:hypothetical protein